MGAGEWRPQFRLRVGRDDEIIAWLASIEPRKRSQAIRRALKAYLRGERRAAPRDGRKKRRENPDLAQALDALFGA